VDVLPVPTLGVQVGSASFHTLAVLTCVEAPTPGFTTVANRMVKARCRSSTVPGGKVNVSVRPLCATVRPAVVKSGS
jgi:hypothetical protein